MSLGIIKSLIAATGFGVSLVTESDVGENLGPSLQEKSVAGLVHDVPDAWKNAITEFPQKCFHSYKDGLTTPQRVNQKRLSIVSIDI